MGKLIQAVQLLNGEGELITQDVRITEDKISEIGEQLEVGTSEVIDGGGLFLAPGFIDVHVHLREPGGEHKETIESGTLAAAKGGYTTICPMPNTRPVPDTKENLTLVNKLIEEKALIRVLPYASITIREAGKERTNLEELKEHGAFAFTDDGVGIQAAGMMYEAMQDAAKIDMAIVAHCEDNTLIYGGALHEGKRNQELGLPGIPSIAESVHIARDVLLAEAAGAHYHVCHVSTKESVRVIRDAKKAGIHVTAEVSPHHLLLSENDIPSDDADWKMNPPLRGEADLAALREGLLDGTLDFIATDHAPHTADEKAVGSKTAPFGITGLETAFPLLYTNFVKKGTWTLAQLIDWMTKKPADVFKLPYGRLAVGETADLVLIDLNKEQEIDRKTFVSKGKNTPFDGWTCAGWPVKTIFEGQVVWEDGKKMKTRMLILEDGTIFEGAAFGSDEASIGETVFTTGMTGYQETISNPSNCGQIVVMTYPLVGNYGINRDDFESIEPAMNGIVVRELTEEPSNFRSGMSLGELLTQKNIPGIQGIDTRKLTRLLREKGPLKGILTAAGEEIANVDEKVAYVKAHILPTDQVAQVSTKRPYPSPGRGERVVLIDYGMKHGILRELNKRGCDIIVVPYNTPADEICSLFPDGIVLSNGPGNPEDVEGAVETIKSLLGTAPIFGIGLGHQLLALASGARIVRLKNGHRGSNHPVKDLATGRTELTAQNHGYAVEEASLEGTGLEVTHKALNDNSVEGLESTKHTAFSVQFYPEASPGPEDSNHLFDRFTQLMTANNRKEQFNA